MPGSIAWKGYGKLQDQSHQQIGHKSEPDNHPGPAESVDLDYAVVNYITYREYRHTGRHGRKSYVDSLYLDQVGHNQANAEQQGQHHEWSRDMP